MVAVVVVVMAAAWLNINRRRRQRLAATILPRRTWRSVDDPQVRKRRFIAAHPAYGYHTSRRGWIDTWRVREFGLIAPLGAQTPKEAIVYLDHAGAALPLASQLACIAVQASTVLANPHSTGPAAAAAAGAMERARQQVLEHFCGDRAGEWELVWTSGATAALRIAAEAFPFSRGESSFIYSHNAHTSVLGMRVPAAAAGAACHCVPLEALEALAAALGSSTGSDQLEGLLSAAEHVAISAAGQATSRGEGGQDGEGSSSGEGGCSGETDEPQHLVILPAECNLTGDRPPIAAIAQRLSSGRGRGRCWVMLDAAKAAATAPLDLPASGAAMACLSLYKIFGEPTGLGALLVRADLATRLRTRARFFGGGSVSSVLATEAHNVPKTALAAALSPGTAHFRGALAVPAGFAMLDALGGMEAVAAHTAALSRELVDRLRALRHTDGPAAVVLYGKWADEHAHHVAESGPTVAFNMRRRSGELVGYTEVTKLAALHTPPIQLRGGCCCNPGGCQRALGLSNADVLAAAASGKTCGDEMDSFEGRPTGVVRASIGKDTIWEDVDALIAFLQATFVATAPAAAPAAAVASTPRLGAIYVYPLKSCAAMRADRWWIDAQSGRLLYDREWALVDRLGNVMRLEHYPRLCTIRPSLRLDARRRATALTLEAEGRAPLVIPLGDEAEEAAEGGGGGRTEAGPSDSATAAAGSVCSLNVCGKDCAASDCGGAAATVWLSGALGVQCRLVRHRARARPALPSGDGGSSDVGGRAGGGSAGSGWVLGGSAGGGSAGVAFANEAPLLVLADSAVVELNRSLAATGEATVTSRHFRPNLVLAGEGIHRVLEPKPIDGDGERARMTFSGGRLCLRVSSSCARCAMVEIDPTSGARHGSVLRALARHYRVRSRLQFGVFCEPVPPQKSTHLPSTALPTDVTSSALVLLVEGSVVALGTQTAN